MCGIGYTGLLCETEVDHCIESKCVGGRCTNSQTGYTCNCDLGYSGDYCDIPPGNPSLVLRCSFESKTSNKYELFVFLYIFNLAQIYIGHKINDKDVIFMFLIASISAC